jgi:hypothetical protein
MGKEGAPPKSPEPVATVPDVQPLACFTRPLMTTAKRRSLAKPLHLAKQRLVDAEDAGPSTGSPLWIQLRREQRELDRVLALMGVRLRASAPEKQTCGARTRRGSHCRALGLANGRCRHHGGLSTGPKTQGGWERTREGYRAFVERRRNADRAVRAPGGPLEPHGA